jgi:CubicO group peptidase (beta-lactamase class C family)
LYFPAANASWETVAPDRLAWNAGALERALTFAAENNSTGVVILYRGRIAAEKYWTAAAARETRLVRQAALPVDPDGRPVEDVASVQKSVIAVLIGMAIEKGLLDLDAPVTRYLGRGWSKAGSDAEEKITIRHLMSMTSGLSVQLEADNAPGVRWLYNTPAYSRLITVLARVTGLEPNQYTSAWLGTKIGMATTRWISRPAGGPNPYGLTMTARDLARFGILMLADGRWGATQVVPSVYAKSLMKTSQSLNPSYGLLWWTNGADRWQDWDAASKPGRLVPAAPADLYAARGAGDHRLYVVPSLGLVITRFGTGAEVDGKAAGPQYFDQQFWSRLAQVFPSAR